jgi:xanthine dehydrogenase accessory factor
MNIDSPADPPVHLAATPPNQPQVPLKVGKDVPPGEIYRVIARLLGDNRRVAIATVIHAVGSTPRKVGARAVIESDGRIHGTIGGGLVEAEAQRRAILAIDAHRPEVFECRMEGDGGPDASPICGGVMRVVIDPGAGRNPHAYACAAQAIERRERGLLLTRLRQDDPPVMSAEWMSEPAARSAAGFPGADRLASCLDREEPCVFVDQPDLLHSTIVVAEPVIPRPLLLIVGGGHVGQAVAAQAHWVGFDIAVIDDRPEFAHPALFPESATLRCGDIAAEVAGFPLDLDTYIILVTRGHRHDAVALAACIRRPAAYLGMIGSRRKVALMQRDFLQTGRATPEEWAKVFAPIGLPIRARTVPEIAASIVAQLIAVRRGALSANSLGKPKSAGATSDIIAQSAPGIFTPGTS